jgi:hypothetical protein
VLAYPDGSIRQYTFYVPEAEVRRALEPSTVQEHPAMGNQFYSAEFWVFTNGMTGFFHSPRSFALTPKLIAPTSHRATCMLILQPKVRFSARETLAAAVKEWLGL